MTKRLQIGKEVFDYPQQGTGAGYGEDATAWAEQVTKVLAEFSGPNDILLTQANLSNNQITPANITGLLFDLGRVQHVIIEFLIKIIYHPTLIPLTTAIKLESGQIIGNYDGIDFIINTRSAGEAGVTIGVNNLGQFTYTSDNLTNHEESVIYFRARTIDL